MAAEQGGRNREEELYTLGYMQQVYQNQYNSLVSEINRNVQYLNELSGLKKTLESSGMADNKDVLVNLGGGAYMNSRIKKFDSVLVEIGAGLVIEKRIDEAKLFVDSRIEKATQMFNSLVKNRNDLREAILDVAHRIDALDRK